MKSATVFFVSTVFLSGCSFSGLDGYSSFSCKAPNGVVCESMEGVYINALHKNLPGQRVGSPEKGARFEQANDDVKNGLLTTSFARNGAYRTMTRPLTSGAPIRRAPRILRVWLNVWEDSDGDLHDQSYVYLPVDNGAWQVEHNKRRISDAFRPIRPTASPSTMEASNEVETKKGWVDKSLSAGEQLVGAAQEAASEAAASFKNLMPGRTASAQ